MTTHRATRPSTGPAWLGFGVALALGVATWAVWLAWETGYTYDATTGLYHGPYSTGQVVACAVTFALVTALTAMRWNPFAVAAGTTLGMWMPWTARAAIDDATGLFLVGSVLLLAGLIVASTVAAAIGYRCRRLLTTTATHPRPRRS